jgi:hypothetical protein
MLQKRDEALHTKEFPNFEHALTLFNYYGERHVAGHFTLQDYYFASRRSTASPSPHSTHHHRSNHPVVQSKGEVCTRCGNSISRHTVYFIDTAKRRSEADLLCRPCLVVAARQVFSSTFSSDIDAVLAQEVQRLHDMKWIPIINVELADMLLETRTFFS